MAVLPRRKSPWLATVAVACVAASLVPFGEVGVIASLSSFSSLLAFASVNVALILLRQREPRERRPFRVPGEIGGFPILPAIGVVATMAVATQLDRKAIWSGGTALSVFLLYSIWRRRIAGSSEPSR